MSASSDYTLTPNLGLFKPIANAAVGLWGDLLNTNADTIDSAIHASTGGGPYLPLAGNATVFGPVTFSAATTFSSPATFTAPLNWTATGGTASRAAQDRSGDWQNVKDFGALLDGTVSVDGPAIGAALAALKPQEAIFFPAGTANFLWGSVQGTTPTTPVLFRLDGTTSGGNPMVRAFSRNNMGDLFETYYLGTKYLSVESAHADAQGPLRVDFFNLGSPGNPAHISTPIVVNTSDYAGANTSIWGMHVSFDSYSTRYGVGGQVWPQHVGISASVRKHGSHWITGFHTTTAEMNNLPSSVNVALIGMEIGHHANADDDGGLPGAPGLRLGIHLSQSEQPAPLDGNVTPTWPAVFGMGFNMDGTPNAITKSCFGCTGVQTYQVFDARTATAPSGYASPVAALRMDPGQIIDFNGANTAASANWKAGAGNYLQYTTTGTARLRYMAGASEVWSVSDNGGLSSPSLPTNLLFYGAVMNGTTSDQTPLTNAFVATPALGVIRIPSGNINPGAFAPTSKPMLWQCAGTYTGSGTLTLGTIGNGVVETMYGTWSKYFNRGSSVGITSLGPVVRIDSTINHAGGTAGGVEALQVNAFTTAASTAAAFPFGISGRLTMSSTQVNGPAGVGVFGSAVRSLGAGNASPFGANFLTDDQTGLSSVNGGSAVGTEVDLKANKLDDGTLADGFQFGSGTYPGSQRAVLTVQYGRSDRSDNTPMEVAKILQLGLFSATVDGAYCSAKLGINLQGTISFAGLSFLHATINPGAQAIALAADQSISWTADATNVVPTNWSRLQYRAATQRLYYSVNGVDMWSVDASGNVRAKGTVTGSTTP